MKAFVVELDNRPGELARLADALAERGINITAIGAVAAGTTAGLGLTTNDDASTRTALDGAGIIYRELDLVAASLEDKPGTLADAARRLADAGVNIELLLDTGRSGNRIDMAIGVDNVAAARQALGDLARVGI
jgi:hypothetical protein